MEYLRQLDYATVLGRPMATIQRDTAKYASRLRRVKMAWMETLPRTIRYRTRKLDIHIKLSTD